jgi:hypothetical protein
VRHGQKATVTAVNRWILGARPRTLPAGWGTYTFWQYAGDYFFMPYSTNGLFTVPTANNRKGDFSDLLALGSQYQIYDPLTVRPDPARPGSFIRTPFPNNIIPANRFDPVMAKMMNAYPAPTNSGRVTNYLTNLSQQQNWDQGDVRVDHQFSSKDNFFARWSIQATSTIQPNNYPAVSIPGLPGPVKLGNEDSFAGTSFSPDQLKTNLMALIDALNKSRPKDTKGIYLRKISVSSTMGAGVRVDTAGLTQQAPAH